MKALNPIQINFVLYTQTDASFLIVYFQMNDHGSILSPDACNFYKVLNAPERVVSIAADGLKLPFDKKLPTFWYKNNASARNNLSFVREKANEWFKDGFVEKVKFRPRHISPLTVSTRVIHTGEVKRRFILMLLLYIHSC